MILNKGVIDKVSNCRRQEGSEGGMDGRTHRIVNSNNTNAGLGSVAVQKPNVVCILLRLPLVPGHNFCHDISYIILWVFF